MGCLELASDPRFTTAELRRENNKELISLLDHYFSQKDRNHWRSELDKIGGITFSYIATMDDVFDDHQARAAGFIIPFEDGKSVTVNSPFEIDGVKKIAPKRSAAIGQHTREVLKEIGYSEGQIEAMLKAGAIGETVPDKAKL